MCFYLSFTIIYFFWQNIIVTHCEIIIKIKFTFLAKKIAEHFFPVLSTIFTNSLLFFKAFCSEHIVVIEGNICTFISNVLYWMLLMFPDSQNTTALTTTSVIQVSKPHWNLRSTPVPIHQHTQSVCSNRPDCSMATEEGI